MAYYFIRLTNGDRPIILANTAETEDRCRYFQLVLAFERPSDAVSEFDNVRFERISREEVVRRYGRNFAVIDGRVTTEGDAWTTWVARI